MTWLELEDLLLTVSNERSGALDWVAVSEATGDAHQAHFVLCDDPSCMCCAENYGMPPHVIDGVNDSQLLVK